MRQHSPHARIVFYMVWSSQNDSETQQTISENVYRAARDNGAVVAPVGEAKWVVHEERPDLMLHRTPEDSHPGHVGAYLIACALYAAITDHSPIGLPDAVMVPVSYDFPVVVRSEGYREKFDALDPDQPVEWRIDADTAAYLQRTAWAVYRESEGDRGSSGGFALPGQGRAKRLR